jgi:hypothetical protein
VRPLQEGLVRAATLHVAAGAENLRVWAGDLIC